MASAMCCVCHMAYGPWCVYLLPASNRVQCLFCFLNMQLAGFLVLDPTPCLAQLGRGGQGAARGFQCSWVSLGRREEAA